MVKVLRHYLVYNMIDNDNKNILEDTINGLLFRNNISDDDIINIEVNNRYGTDDDYDMIYRDVNIYVRERKIEKKSNEKIQRISVL